MSMSRAAHGSAAAKHRKSKGTKGSTLMSSTQHPDVDDSEQGGETDPLLDPESRSDNGNDLQKRCGRESIFPLLDLVRSDVRATIDTHLDWQELTSLDLNYSIVRPLALKYSQYNNISIIFIFLVNRIQFQRDADRDLALQNVNLTRAALCELLAMKLLRTFARDAMELVTALTCPFSPFQGADQETLTNEGIEADGMPKPGQCSSALELAIFSKAKKFIKTPLCQRCISGIYEGRVVLSYQSSHAIVDDSYKRRPLGFYDPAKAPFLDHYRLRVPAIRNRIEFVNFCLLLLFYVLCLSKKDSPTWTTYETIFVLWLFGFMLDEMTQLQEHGLAMYITSLYNLLDFLFCIIGFCYLGLRISALVHNIPERSSLSFDTLALGAILLCPRVASVLVQDNVILLALKAMLADFCFFMLLAVVCFSGFLYTFWVLSGPEWTAGKIMWIMTKVWFGNSYVGFDTAQSFSVLFGPPLMVFFAIMANTLLLTILISLLSNTFSIVALNASEEAMYQHAVLTISGISTDALFSYMPPLNLLAIIIIMPASFVLSPRWLHKVNIALLRATSWPILLIIRLCSYDFKKPNYLSASLSSSRYMESTAEKASHLISWIPLPRSRSNPDRDIIEAAFAQAKARNMSAGEWQEEWTASMLQLHPGNPEEARDDAKARSPEEEQEDDESTEEEQEDATKGTAGTPRHRHVTDSGEGEGKREAEGFQVGGEWWSVKKSTESPLAKIFGNRSSREEDRRPPAAAAAAASQVVSSPQTPKQRGKESASTSQNRNGKDREAKEKDFGTGGLESYPSSHQTDALLRKLIDKLQEQEEAQVRMEKLLQKLTIKEDDGKQKA